MTKGLKTSRMHKKGPAFYAKLAKVTEHAVGHPAAFGLATLFILGWGVFGPIYFTTTWHSILHTMTASITFLMVFLIQNSESRGSAAIQLKLDELLRTSTGARNALLNIEDLTLDDLEIVRDTIKSCRAMPELVRSAVSRIRGHPMYRCKSAVGSCTGLSSSHAILPSH